MENKKTNQERLEEYLVGEKGYLKENLSNGKVIMLSGKWGSGKTHFWQNKIQTVLNDENKKIPNHYISLYGKTSIQEIKNEVFLKIFEGMDIFKIDDKSVKLAKNTANLVADLTKTVSVFGVNLDLSKIVDKSFEKLEKVREEQKEEKTKTLLNSGAIICFDDFERKSKDIDLNDLFGFITNLTIEFDSRVVIILNDDVFEGEEKNVFSRVKEKSVSKFLKYEPSIEELFNLIFELEIEKDNKKQKKYKDLEPYKQIILKTIEETKELNARIYIQVLDNLEEWIKNQEKDDDTLRCLILVNIYFILYHTIFYKQEGNYLIKDFNDKFELDSNNFNSRTHWDASKENNILLYETVEKYLNYLEKRILIGEQIDINKKYIEDNKKLYESKFFANNLDISKNVDDKTFQKINNFIETGILINE
jgi:hypothetical protein